MPKLSMKQGIGGPNKKFTENADNGLVKANKRLPPLASKIPQRMTRMEMEDSGQINENLQHIQSVDSTDSKKRDVNKSRVVNRRKTVVRAAASTNSASSSVHKRVVNRPKVVDVEHADLQLKPKPRKKGGAKTKPPDKPTPDAVDSSAGETNLSDRKTAGSPQWTNIIKRVQIHKPQKNRYRQIRRKDFMKRKRSEYVIENTWIPKDPANSSSNTQKQSKKTKTKNSKARENRKGEGDGGISVEISKSEQQEALGNSEISDSTSAEISGSGLTPAERLATEHLPDEVRADEVRADEADTREMTSVNQPTKMSSPSVTSKVRHSPKLSQNRETTHVKQINVADFAKLHMQTSKTSEAQPTNQNITDYQQRVNKVRFKGASNSVPNYNEKQENIKKATAQNDALLTNGKQTPKHKDHHPIRVSKIEPKSPGKANFLLPNTGPHRNQFMDILSSDHRMEYLGSGDRFPRIGYGSPTPMQNPYNGSDDEMSGEVSIVVPKLPHLKNRNEHQHVVDDKSGSADTSQHTEEEPVVIVTNEDGVAMERKTKVERDGWESGYSSMTPRLSVDSRAHALTPVPSIVTSSAMLEIPNDHRSITPFSTITNSTYIDHSRPQSTFLEVPHLPDPHDAALRKMSFETRHSVHKLPAIYSSNDDYESTDGCRFDFSPLPLQSIRTSDGELSD